MNYKKLLNTALIIPESLENPSAWVGHIPFAMWLIDEIKPDLFVELGTHSGNSYFSFCQSVKYNNIKTICYAVDTWEGDDHAGKYDDSVYEQVKLHNDNNYSHFSSLLRMTFDDANRYFSDKSIGLLHIDGLHTYEAVKHDFEKWLPKVTPGGIVLFHDINVRERDFGVWKLWEELKEQYINNIEFTHSNGLGVLQIDQEISEKKVIEWLKRGNDEKKYIVNIFSSMGDCINRELNNKNLKQENIILKHKINDQIILNQKQERDSQNYINELKKQAADIHIHANNLEKIINQYTCIQSKLKYDLKLYQDRLNQTNSNNACQHIRIGAVSWEGKYFPNLVFSKNNIVEKTKTLTNYLNQNNRHQLRLIKQLLQENPLFDVDFYKKNDPALNKKGIDPIHHYFFHGALEGRNPNPYFFTSWYLAEYPDVAASGINPLLHFLLYGTKEGRNPNPYFFIDWYLDKYLQTTKQEIHPLLHYIHYGSKKHAWPNPYFDPAWYTQTYLISDSTGTEPLMHFLYKSSLSEIYNPNPYFDGSWYLQNYPWVHNKGLHPLQHYINHWKNEETEPNPYFDSKWYSEEYLKGTISEDMCPFEHYVAYVNTGTVNPNPYFDSKWYRKKYPDVEKNGAEPFLHYLIFGAKEFRDPGPYFNTSWYMNKYHDVRKSKINPFLHFIRFGIYENRDPNPEFDTNAYINQHKEILKYNIPPFFHFLTSVNQKHIEYEEEYEIHNDYDLGKINPNKETIFLVSHEASFTGAPILAYNIASKFSNKYNIVAFFLRGGSLLDDFKSICNVVILSDLPTNHQEILETILRPILSKVKFKFSIVNSIVSISVLPVLSKYFIPSICLVHEFASYTHPKNAIQKALFWSDRIVFSAELVYADNVKACKYLCDAKTSILPQGKCEIPTRANTEKCSTDLENAKKILQNKNITEDTVIILGAGTVQIRKGIDLFISCATRIAQMQPKNQFFFLWIGKGFDPEGDMAYSCYIQDQIDRSEISNHFGFINETVDLDPFYSLSSIFFLSSRLDPLPNVVIDAMYKSIPVVCFENTTGFSDILKSNDITKECVVPYIDTEQAAQYIFQLINYPEKRKQIGMCMQEIGENLFNMSSYVESLEKIADECSFEQEIDREDYTVISDAKILDSFFCCHPAWIRNDHENIIRNFLRSWRLGIELRKPFPGFNPGIYIEYCDDSQKVKHNPLADYIQSGYPKGRWIADLIKPTSNSHILAANSQKIALHIHAYYPDIFDDIYQRIKHQSISLDLLISVPDEFTLDIVSAVTVNYDFGKIDIRIVPNRGRDLGPLLTEFGIDILSNYDIIGHIHTKKSKRMNDATTAQRWFSFLIENLVGGKYSMASIILDHMFKDKKIGLVFPDDPNVLGWDANRSLAKCVIQELGITTLPGKYFNFPVGSMFWARSDAIKPLLTKQYTWDDYPEEPIPEDGTMLHAIERLLPSVAEHMGYRVAMTYVPDISR